MKPEEHEKLAEEWIVFSDHVKEYMAKGNNKDDGMGEFLLGLVLAVEIAIMEEIIPSLAKVLVKWLISQQTMGQTDSIIRLANTEINPN